MPLLLIGLLVAALGVGALVVFGGFGGSSDSNSDFWTPEVCNERLAQDVVDVNEFQTIIGKNQKAIEDAERRGDSKTAVQARKYNEDAKANIALVLKYYDNEFARDCDKSTLDQANVARVEAARKLLNGGASEGFKEEGMPDVRVTSIKSTFIPYETDERGECSGPYLDLVFTITNQGADFPRPIDLQTYEERAQRPAKELEFLTVIGELDFGGDMKKRLDFTVKGDTGTLASGRSLEIPAKVKVEYNQTHARIKGSLMGHAFVKTGTAESPPYETEIDIPIWDIYTESHSAIGGKDEQGKYYISTKATVTNKGKTPTPGPIQGSFTINEIDPHRRIESWSGQTEGPVSGSTDIYARTYSDKVLPDDITVTSSIIVMCPSGKVGGLSDGDTKNNIRELQQR